MSTHRPNPSGTYQARDPRGNWGPTTAGPMTKALEGLKFLRQQGVSEAIIVRLPDEAEIACYGCGMTVAERDAAEAAIESEPNFMRYRERLEEFSDEHRNHRTI